jgi:hypothetical protein
MRRSKAARSAGGSLTAMPMESVPRGGISLTASSGVISFDRYSLSYTCAFPG